MTARPRRSRRPLAALATATACSAAVLASGGCGLGGTSDVAAPAGASVRIVDGRGTPTIPPQEANGPVLPVGPEPVPLAVDLETVPDPVRVPFHRPPRAGLLYDLDTGEVLWRLHPTRVLPMASVTKMMTAILVDEQVPAGGEVRITKQAVQTGGSKVGVLPLGREVGVSAMLHGLMLASGNDAAVALAQRVSGTVAGFVDLMNARARAMHLGCTRFASPSGLVDAGNHTCAYDLAALARELLDHPRLARIVARRRAVLPFPGKGGRLELYNHNPLVRLAYPGALGVKTGFTNASGRCIVAAAERDGRRLGVVLLHSPDIGAQAIKLLDRGFAAPPRAR